MTTAVLDAGPLLAGLPPDTRRAIIDAVAPEAIARELRRWEAAGGAEAVQRVVRRAGITVQPPAPSDRDAASALTAWAARPHDERRARAWATAAANPAADYPGVLERDGEGGCSINEAALIVLADAGRPEDDASLARLAAVEARFGCVESPESNDRREDVLALLLRPRDSDRPPPQRSLKARARQVLIGVALSLVVTVLTLLLPHALPGRLPSADLTAAPGHPVAAMGWQFADQRVAVTIRLRDRPGPATELFIGSAGTQSLVVATRVGSQWAARLLGPARYAADRIQIASSGATVVVLLPASARSTGLAVATAADRLPASGYLPPQPEPAARLTVIDLVILALLVAAGIRGFRAGLVATVPVLTGFVLNLVLARLIYPPLGALILGHLTHIPRIADSLAVALVTSVVGIGLYLAAGTGAAAGMGRLAPRVKLTQGAAADEWLGAAVRVLRATASAATLLTLFVNLAAFSVVAGLVHDSVLARGAVDVWRHVYPGL